VLRSLACGLTDDGLFVLCAARGAGDDRRSLADVLPSSSQSVSAW